MFVWIRRDVHFRSGRVEWRRPAPEDNSIKSAAGSARAEKGRRGRAHPYFLRGVGLFYQRQ